MDRASQQSAVRQVLDELKAIADLPPDRFQASTDEIYSLSDIIRTLVKTPALPGFQGPQTKWAGNTMVVL